MSHLRPNLEGLLNSLGEVERAIGACNDPINHQDIANPVEHLSKKILEKKETYLP